MARGLRIAFFTYSDPGETGGVQEYTYQLSRALESRGHSVTVFGPAGKPILPYPKYRAVCRKIPVPSLNGNWTTNTLPYATKPSAAAIINRGHFDLLHIQDPWVPFVGFELLGSVVIPKVATINSGWETDSPAAGFMNFILPFFREVALKSNIGVIFVSRHVQECWRPVISKHMVQKVIYHGIDNNFKANGWVPANPENARLLFVGRLVKRKGVRHLLEAVRPLVKKHRGLTLDIVGGGKEINSLTEFVSAHRLSSHVTFHGQINGSKRIAFFQKAQVFCAPYADEGFPLTVLEAMATGLPIVGFENRAMHESLSHSPGRESLLTKPSAESLSGAITKLLSDRDLQEKVRNWELRESRKYTWEKAARETEKFYFEILGKHA